MSRPTDSPPRLGRSLIAATAFVTVAMPCAYVARSMLVGSGAPSGGERVPDETSIAPAVPAAEARTDEARYAQEAADGDARHVADVVAAREPDVSVSSAMQALTSGRSVEEMHMVAALQRRWSGPLPPDALAAVAEIASHCIDTGLPPDEPTLGELLHDVPTFLAVQIRSMARRCGAAGAEHAAPVQSRAAPLSRTSGVPERARR